MATQTFKDVVTGFERGLKLGTVADLGRKPSITPIEIIACFADIRGFTKFVEVKNNLVADFLPRYFSIFTKAVLRQRWNLEQNDPFQQFIRRQIGPKLAKKLGDGMLLVWEVPDSGATDLKLGLQYAVVDVVGYFQEYFYRLVEDLSRKYGLANPGLELGIGLASGLAWKLDYGLGQIDYAGRPLNVAARLQGQARPKGIYVDFNSFAPNYLLERKCAGEGGTKRIPIDGVGSVDVWFSTEGTLRLRKQRTTAGSNVSELKDLLDAVPYTPRPRQGTDDSSRLPLTEDDIQTLLTIRENVEGEFADIAARRDQAASNYEHLNRLLEEMSSFVDGDENANRFRDVGQTFHEAIAYMSGSNAEEARAREALVKSLHYWTTRIYPRAESDRREMVNEHSKIAHAIMNNLPEVAREEMREHLRRHNARVVEAAFAAKS